MGIKNLNQLMSRMAFYDGVEMTSDMLKGQKIAIDMLGIFHACYPGAAKRVIEITDFDEVNRPNMPLINAYALTEVMDRLGSFYKSGMIPVCIYDGDQKNNPLKEANARISRQASREKANDRLGVAENEYYAAPKGFRDSLRENFSKRVAACISVDRDTVTRSRRILEAMGVTCFVAGDEHGELIDGEALCASLCFHKYCAASFTIDTDLHVFGGTLALLTRFVVRDNITNEQSLIFKSKSTRNIIDALSYAWSNHTVYLTDDGNEKPTKPSTHPFTYDTFIEICIMLGTDFNPNIKGYGLVKVWNTMKEYGSIKAIGESGIDISCLNHKEVAEHFAKPRKPLDIDIGTISHDTIMGSLSLLTTYNLEHILRSWI